MIKKCTSCGSEFETTTKKRICDKCRKNNDKLRCREYRKEQKIKRQLKGVSASLADDVRNADSLHMSYGKYMGIKRELIFNA